MQREELISQEGKGEHCQELPGFEAGDDEIQGGGKSQIKRISEQQSKCGLKANRVQRSERYIRVFEARGLLRIQLPEQFL